MANYGLSIDGVDISAPIMQRNPKSLSFSNYTGGRVSTSNSSTDSLKECYVGDAAKTMVFAKKNSAKSTKVRFHRPDYDSTVIIGDDALFLDVRGNKLYIVCKNPSLWSFIIGSDAGSISGAGNYGIRVYNSSGGVVYDSSFQSIKASKVISLSSLNIKDSIFLRGNNGVDVERRDVYIDSFTLTHNATNVGAGNYVRLGCSLASLCKKKFRSTSRSTPGTFLHSILVDSNGDLYAPLCVGVISNVVSYWDIDNQSPTIKMLGELSNLLIIKP